MIGENHEEISLRFGVNVTLTMISPAIAQYVAPLPTNPLQDRQLRDNFE
jgi:hypothetical protein